MESWKREETQYYNRGAKKGRSRKGPRARPHTDPHPLLGQNSTPATLTPNTAATKTKSACCGRDGVSWKEEISDTKTHSRLAGSPALEIHVPTVAGLAEPHPALTYQAS